MRILIAALPLLSLAACGGASGPESIGSVAPPAAPTPTSPTTPGSGGTGGGVTPGTGTGTGGGPQTPTQAHFLDVSAETTFDAIGGFQSLNVGESGTFGLTGPVMYTGNASTVRAPSGSVIYNPRDGIFTINFADPKANVSNSVRFQDPAHRSATPAWGVPDLNGFNIIESLGPTARAATATDLGRRDTVTFFYQRPGSQTTYVSLAGYVRNAYEPTADALVFKAQSNSLFERGAMVFGQETIRSQIPIVGSGTYTGGLLATMVVNTNINNSATNYFQWITGSSQLSFDFSRSTMDILLTGTVGAATYAGQTVPANMTGMPGGSTFRAVGNGTIDLTASGGFTGSFSSVTFNNGATVPVYDRVNPVNSTAGANSIDGTFFGPGAVNVGGNFRVVGGVPDQRVDILGAFTGAKQ